MSVTPVLRTLRAAGAGGHEVTECMVRDERRGAEPPGERLVVRTRGPSFLACAAFVVTAAACRARETARSVEDGAVSSAEVAATASRAVGGATAPPLDGGDAATSEAPPRGDARPRGTARLVVEHVDAVCAIWESGGAKMHRWTIGEDLLVELADDDGVDGGAAKPRREHVFCPAQLADGGVTKKPRLGIWRSCREDKVCRALDDAGPDGHDVLCGRDRVRLEIRDGRTLLRGPFGERVLAPHPMLLAPTTRTKRDAMVDC